MITKTEGRPLAGKAAPINNWNNSKKNQANSQEIKKDTRSYGDLEVVPSNLPATAAKLGTLLAAQPMLFDRGGPARLVYDVQHGGLVAELLTPTGIVNECHEIAQPWKQGEGGRIPVTLSERISKLYLDRKGRWGLRPLDGISYAPLLAEDGSMRTIDGYDEATKLWCERIPSVDVPENPTRYEAEAALIVLRKQFHTFTFADAPKLYDPLIGGEVVDLSKPPGEDETSALATILTGVCRPSLWLSPAGVFRAPAFSGAGTGKGLLARGVCALAFGTKPEATTMGGTLEEFDKRISAALISAAETFFIDNLNGVTLKSDVLASALTERPCRVRVLGKSVMVPLNASTLVLITGNGLLLSEDMVRRCLVVELDAGVEDPEQRCFPGDFVQDVLARRGDLLRAALTIWRWGRLNAKDLTKGRPLGSYDQWCRWVRDPLLTLGCRDPVEKMTSAKADDPRRRATVQIFTTWWEVHGDRRIAASQLSETVRDLIDPQKRGRQYVAARLQKLEGTRMAGFVLTKSNSGTWGADIYQLQKTS